jgi:glycosyltransferase involved in cell wall biosynthesis
MTTLSTGRTPRTAVITIGGLVLQAVRSSDDASLLMFDRLSQLLPLSTSRRPIGPSSFCVAAAQNFIEYVATERPIVASVVPSVSNLLLDQGIVAPDSPQPLTKAIRQVLTDPDVAYEMGKRGWTCVEMFTRVTVARTSINEISKTSGLQGD